MRTVVEDNTAIETVELDGLSKGQAEIVALELLEAQSRGYLDNLRRVTTDTEYGNPRIYGLYDPNDRAIFINPDYFTRKSIQQAYDRGWFAQNTLAYPVHHELGHHLHYEIIRGYANPFERGSQLDSVSFSTDTEERIKREVSHYAIERLPYEFVAEVSALKWAGRSVSSELETLYEKYDGPTP